MGFNSGFKGLMDRSIEVTRQLEKVFEPYSMVITEMKGGKKYSGPNAFLPERKIH